MSKCGSGKTCRPTVQCSAQIPDTKDLKNSMCQMEDGSTGTCCGDVPKSWGPMADKVVQRGGIAASFVPERRTITINIPNNKKLSMFDRGISWAKNITNYSRRVKVATSSTSLQHASFLKSKPGKLVKTVFLFLFFDNSIHLSCTKRPLLFWFDEIVFITPRIRYAIWIFGMF